MSTKNNGKTRENSMSTYTLVLAGVMAALVFVGSKLRIPVGQSAFHLGNIVCLLCGLLLGPIAGGSAAGLGSALFDMFGTANKSYTPPEVIITFVSKFLMAYVCAKIAGSSQKQRQSSWRIVFSCIIGALTYIALYMLKTWVYQRFVYHHPLDTIPATMIGKLVPSLFNAAAAIVVAPLFYHAILPALKPLMKRVGSR